MSSYIAHSLVISEDVLGSCSSRLPSIVQAARVLW